VIGQKFLLVFTVSHKTFVREEKEEISSTEPNAVAGGGLFEQAI